MNTHKISHMLYEAKDGQSFVIANIDDAHAKKVINLVRKKYRRESGFWTRKQDDFEEKYKVVAKVNFHKEEAEQHTQPEVPKL